MGNLTEKHQWILRTKKQSSIALMQKLLIVSFDWTAVWRTQQFLGSFYKDSTWNGLLSIKLPETFSNFSRNFNLREHLQQRKKNFQILPKKIFIAQLRELNDASCPRDRAAFTENICSGIKLYCLRMFKRALFHAEPWQRWENFQRKRKTSDEAKRKKL